MAHSVINMKKKWIIVAAIIAVVVAASLLCFYYSLPAKMGRGEAYCETNEDCVEMGLNCSEDRQPTCAHVRIRGSCVCGAIPDPNSPLEYQTAY
jgi:hypothetical protein